MHDQAGDEVRVRGGGGGSVQYGRDWGFGIGDSEKCASGSGNMPSPTPVRRILATTREIGMAMLLRIPNPESRIPVIQKIPHSVPQSLAAGFEMRLRPPFGPRHVAAQAGAVAQPGRELGCATCRDRVCENV